MPTDLMCAFRFLFVRDRVVVAAAAVLAVLFVVAPRADAQRGGMRPAVEVEPRVLEMGDVAPGEMRTKVVSLRNTGDTDLVIDRTRSSCACTVPVLGSRVIRAGESIEVEVTLTGLEEKFGRTGQQVLFLFEGFALPIQLAVVADVNWGIRITREYVPDGQFAVADITLESIDGSAFSVESVNELPVIYVDGFDPEAEAPRARYVVRQDFSAFAAGMVPGVLVVETDSVLSPVMVLPNEMPEAEPPRVRRPFFIESSPIVLPALSAGGQYEREIVLRAVQGEASDLLDWFDIRAERASCTLLGVRVEPEKSLAYLRVGIRPYPDHRGMIRVHAWATIGDHTEHVLMYGRVFDPDVIKNARPGVPGEPSSPDGGEGDGELPS